MTKLPTKKTKTKKRKRPLTKIRNKYAELLAQNIKPIDAAKEAGYTGSSLKSNIYRTAKELIDNGTIESIQERNNRITAVLGTPAAVRIAKFIDLTSAKKVVTASDKGIITDERFYDDGTLQLAAAKELSKLCGDYPAERSDVHVAVSFEDMLFADLRAEREAIDIEPV